MAGSWIQTAMFSLLGLNRGGRILYRALFVAGIAIVVWWTVVMPRARFSDEDERLFRAARHGDLAGLQEAIAAGAHVNGASPVDGKTALFRAAVFGHADAVRLLLERGADPQARGSDGRNALEVVEAAIAEEKHPDPARALAGVAGVLQGRGVTQ